MAMAMSQDSQQEETEEILLITEELGRRKAYITKELVDRDLEIQARKHVVEVFQKMKETKSKQRKFLQTAVLSFPREMLDAQLTDVLEDLGNPETTEDFCKGLLSMAKKSAAHVSFADVGRNLMTGIQSSRAHLLPPLPHHQVQMTPNNQTPHQQRQMLPFSSAYGTKVLPSAVKKQPRLAKPGEPVYTFSATGSPVVVHATPAVPPSDNAARVKVDAGNGQMIDVDLVFRGGPQDARNRIVTDFRCWAKSRSTVQSRKLLPHRVPIKKNTSLNRKL